jgi:hypothetical protein
MPRGAAGAAKTQLGTTNAIAATQQGKADALQAQTTPGYTSLMNTGYLDPADAAAATTSEMGAATQPFQTAGFTAKNNAAATNNASSLTANEDQLALEEGQVSGQTAAGLQQQKMQNQQAGMYGLNQQQAADTGETESMYGLAPSTINAWSSAQASNPVLGLANSVIGAGGQALGGYLSGGGKNG